jgi:hypothetical protein
MQHTGVVSVYDEDGELLSDKQVFPIDFSTDIAWTFNPADEPQGLEDEVCMHVGPT